MTKHTLRILCLLTALTTLASCDSLVAKFVNSDDIDFLSDLSPQKKESAQVSKVVFSPDYKTFTVTTRMTQDIGPYSLLDTSRVRIVVRESVEGIEESRHSLPQLISARNTKAENIQKSGIKLLALIDASLPQATLNTIRDQVTELRAVFNSDNLYVSFMQGNNVSDAVLATDYVLNNHFRHCRADSVLLYRFILQKRDEMVAHQGPWADARKTILLTFSNERLYDEKTDSPYDRDHYKFEEILVHTDSATADPDFMACYASVRPLHETSDDHEAVVLHLFCKATHGIFMQPYNGTDFKNHFLNYFHISPDANEFTFENPDGKVYRGNHETLTVRFLDAHTDSVVTSFSTAINLGNIYNPIIVRGRSIAVIIIWGFFLGALIALAAWILFQFIIPFIRYRYFLRKYVVSYTGANMGIGSTLVQESCYLCKEPFHTGDEIVVKCEHTMHKSCWDENEYHCPEYSDRCKHGSHYYNRQNLSDPRNASFYLRWILLAIIAGWLAWLLFIIRRHTLTEFVANQVMDINDVSPLSSFGFLMGFFLTVAIAALSARLSSFRHHLIGILSRAIAAAFGCFVMFFIFDLIIIYSGAYLIEVLIAWVPWTLSGIIIAFCGTYGTRVRLRKRLLLPGIAFGILSMYAWWLFFDTELDYRVLLLISFIIYAVGLAVSIACISPRSERYFLKTQGAIKEVDIALYKWFRNAPDRAVTLGKSVDCSLQLSWDVMGEVAPVHAEIRLHHKLPYLVALEEGVYSDGRPLKVGRKLWLLHGRSFTIGNTTFTYIEKDR